MDAALQYPPGSADDRFRGMMYGALVASAVALPCDGRDSDILRDNTNHEGGLKYPRPPGRDAVREYPPNDWASDLDQAFLVMRAVREKGVGDDFEQAFAAQLLRWAGRGLSDLGDAKPAEIDSVTFRVVSHESFQTTPAAAAKEILGGEQLGSTPILRCLPLAALPLLGIYDSLPRAVRVTHPDRRVAAGALFEVLFAAAIIKGQPITGECVRFPIGQGLKILDQAHKLEFRKTFDATKTLGYGATGAGLEESDNAGHASKSVRAALWAYRQLLATPASKRGPELFRRCVTEIALCGRKASQYSAIAGAILGACLGMSGIPGDWLQGLPNIDWVEGEISEYLALFEPPLPE